MPNHREAASRVLKSYFRTAFEAAGLKWNSDNDIEIEDVVCDILISAKNEED